jgi:Pyruvate/2-oxoacid:ferredoxin oxidoreductase gamma subunit
MADSHASFVGRTTATDHDLAPMLARAIAHTGFSVVEILELCTEHATSRNALTGKALAEIALRHGEELGVIVDNADREEFGKLYAAAGDQGKAEAADPGIQVHYPHALDRPISILLAGSAGERVQSAAGMFCEAAAMCGLQVAQKNDNPVTQGSGFSLSEINLSPEAIDYTGIDSPDVCIIASADGYRELQERDMFNRFSDETIVIVDESLPITEGGCTRLPLRSLCGNTKAAAAGLHHFLTLRGIFPLQAFNAVLQKKAQADEPYLPAAFISLAAKGQKPF